MQFLIQLALRNLVLGYGDDDDDDDGDDDDIFCRQSGLAQWDPPEPHIH